MATFDMEVDVAIRRPPSPSNIRTHHVRVMVEEASPSRMENEARNLAAGMVASARGPMVTAVRIVSAEL